MKKNRLMMACAIAGSALLVTSVVAFAAVGSGYESYKKAAKGLLTVDNATISVEVELKDNGKIILSGDSVMMVDGMRSGNENAYSRSSFIMDGKTHVSESSSIDGRVTMNHDGQYTSFTADPIPPRGDEGSRTVREEVIYDENSNVVKLAELIIDTLVGDVKNQFIKSNDTITVELQGPQIPELARLGISAVLEIVKSESLSETGQDSVQALFDRIPQLSTVDVKSLSLISTVDNDILKSNYCKAVISGTDTNGVYHEMEITMNMNISDIGSTVVKDLSATDSESN